MEEQQNQGQQNNEWQNPYGNSWQQSPQRPTVSKFALAAMICGAIAAFTLATVIIPIICGSLAVMFAFLSREKEGPMERMAKWGGIIGGISMAGILLMSGITIGRFYFDKDFRQQTEDMIKQTLGFSLEELQNLDYENMDSDGTSLYDMLMKDLESNTDAN